MEWLVYLFVVIISGLTFVSSTYRILLNTITKVEKVLKKNMFLCRNIKHAELMHWCSEISCMKSVNVVQFFISVVLIDKVLCSAVWCGVVWLWYCMAWHMVWYGMVCYRVLVWNSLILTTSLHIDWCWVFQSAN